MLTFKRKPMNYLHSIFKDCTVKIWRPSDGVLCRTLSGHAHWINTLALNVDYILRIGSYSAGNKSAFETDIENVCSNY